MGRTLPSFTQLILGEQSALAKFRRALRREDQRALDDLFRAARYHVAAAAYASHLLPFETMLLAMLIEEHKRVERLTVLLEGVLEKMRNQETGQEAELLQNRLGGMLNKAKPLSLPDAETLPLLFVQGQGDSSIGEEGQEALAALLVEGTECRSERGGEQGQGDPGSYGMK